MSVKQDLYKFHLWERLKIFMWWSEYANSEINWFFPPWLITRELGANGVVEKHKTVTLHLFVIYNKSV